mgnify:CR=1 FL=1
MLVIHPTDRTTKMLSILYEGVGARVIESDCSNKEMGHLLHHTSPSERIMLLGHGSNKGLYFRMNDEEEYFDGIIVGHPQAYYLRKHCGGIIGLFVLLYVGILNTPINWLSNQILNFISWLASLPYMPFVG